MYTSTKFCQLCNNPVGRSLFPSWGNLCFSCEVDNNQNIKVTKKGKISVRQNRDWLRAARGSGHYPLTFNFVLGRNGKSVQCSYCGCFVPEIEVTRDHVYPKSRGGIIKTPSCGFCNTEKSNMLPIEWAIYAYNTNIDLPNVRNLVDTELVA